MIDQIKKLVEHSTEDEVKSLLFHMLLRINMAQETEQDQLVIDLKNTYQNFVEYKRSQAVTEKTYEAVHILFGDSASGSLKMTLKERDVGDAKVLAFSDVFSIGPIWKLHEERGIHHRYEWLENHILFEGDELAECHEMFNETISEIEAIPDHIPITIWVGGNAHEQTALRYVLYLLKGKQNVLYIMNTTHSHTLHTGELSPEKMGMMYEHVSAPLNKEQRIAYEEEWQELSATQEVLRIWENGEIKRVREDYFDEYIIHTAEKLHKELENHGFMKSARLIGEVLGHVEQYIDDGYFEYRVRYLIMNGVFEIKGVPKAMRFYSVKRK
ncbi:DUF1835 domain-containing protein [Rossellomorea aquimaris]|uniref:DUF1835 domain-containing protein n=1 Tax=Rossellomorea aquimaris TaxID=189382 RepID=UPI0011E8BBF9|nr:DUF1835 domain-containing protein [Rossellomorea aquimaris]TYS89845.1 DUF1835 domain-containing protein [Rossellomorea aquimaris]